MIHNPDLDVVKNKYDSLIDIGNLSPTTYTEISKYLDKIEHGNKQTELLLNLYIYYVFVSNNLILLSIKVNIIEKFDIYSFYDNCHK